ncbi:MAG: hypothetical protein JWN13_7054 [Betaproteobacteria bacterium]|jgi:hypothetical protein|nr:hypothetical protein [Betaproteobacteria bacterium]
MVRVPLLPILVVLSFSFVASYAQAAPDEIQVYMDDLTKPGRFGSDFHSNYVVSGSREPDFPGAQPAHHTFRFTPEFYYGLSPTMELGLYLLTTTGPGTGSNYDGQKLRFKYIAPHDDRSGSFWGMNLEIGKSSRRVGEVPWNAQLKGIYGYRSGPWTVAFNTNFDWSLSGSPNSPVAFEFDTKVAYETPHGFQLGFESYNELGPVRHLGHIGDLSQTLYAVIDSEIRKVDVNFGIGRGLTPASDRWVMKLVVGIQY